MRVIYYDGGVLECSEIEISGDGKALICDECYDVPILEVVRIVESTED